MRTGLDPRLGGMHRADRLMFLRERNPRTPPSGCRVGFGDQQFVMGEAERGVVHSGIQMPKCVEGRTSDWAACTERIASSASSAAGGGGGSGYEPCISLARATPPGRSRYQTSGFPTTSEFPTELATNRGGGLKTDEFIPHEAEPLLGWIDPETARYFKFT